MRKPSKSAEMQGRKEQREALASSYPWAAAEQHHFMQLGDAAMIELENAYKLELQWLNDFKETLAGKNHADPILIVSKSNTSVHLTATDTNDSQSKRSHSSLLIEEEAIHPTPSPVSSSSTSSSINDDEPSVKRNRAHRTSIELSPAKDTNNNNNMETQQEVIEINSSVQPIVINSTSPSSKLTETSPPMVPVANTLNTPTRISASSNHSLITGNHPFINNTAMSTPTTTVLSSKGKPDLLFNSTVQQLSKPQWHDLSPINTMSSPIVLTTPTITTTMTTTTATNTTTTTTKTIETASTLTSTRPLSSGESSKKDEEWMSPGVVRHKSLFTHFTSLSTMMTSNQKLKKQGIENNGTHKQLPMRNSTVRRDLVAELQNSVTDSRGITITATATTTAIPMAATPKTVRVSPFKPIGIAFSQQRVTSMREIIEENEEVQVSPNEKSSSLLSDEEERLREEGRVKSFFMASTEALKQRLQSLRAKSSIFIVAESSSTATPESNVLTPVSVKEKQNERVEIAEQQPVKMPQTSRVKIDNDTEKEDDAQVFQDASDRTPRHSVTIDKNHDVFVDALQSPNSSLQQQQPTAAAITVASLMDNREQIASVEIVKTEAKTTDSKTTVRSRPQIKALAKAHEAAKKEQEINAQREERKRKIEAIRLKQAQERQQATNSNRDPMLRPSYTMTNRVKKPELSTARIPIRSTTQSGHSNNSTTTRGPGLFKRTIQKTTMADKASRFELNKQPPLTRFTESSSTSVQSTIRTGLPPTRPNHKIKPLFAKKSIAATTTSSRSTTTTSTANSKLFSRKFDTDTDSVLDDLLSPLPSHLKPPTSPATTTTTTNNESQSEFTTIAVTSKKSTGEVVYDLPEIESDYTDDDRTPKRPNTTANTVPHWAQPTNLTQQLRQQQKVDPDRIFGRVEPIRMEAIFRGREEKYRHRTSSAHWIGTDRLTEEEEQAYRERMGYL